MSWIVVEFKSWKSVKLIGAERVGLNWTIGKRDRKDEGEGYSHGVGNIIAESMANSFIGYSHISD